MLKRTKFNTPQVEIPDWQTRKENISGVFEITPDFLNEEVGGWKIKKIILVDDVSTSGATLEEAAGILNRAGIKEIYGLVVAKG